MSDTVTLTHINSSFKFPTLSKMAKPHFGLQYTKTTSRLEFRSNFVKRRR